MSRTAHKLMASSGGKDAYEIEQSLTLDRTDTPKLRRTPSSEGNRKTFTFSTWCKRSDLGLSGGGSNFHYLMGAAKTSGWSDDSHYFAFGFFHDDTLALGGWVNNWRITNRKFRDPSAWYHIVLQFDTTQGTADNRIKIYVNGVQETSFSTNANPSQNYDVAINNTVPQSISDVAYDAGTGPYHFDGYMAETHFLDGTIKAPSDFGKTDSETGQWIPKEYGGGSYGTNGYYMKYVSGAIGTDSSGQGNNYTTTNLANSDVVLDTPTNNFPTVNSNEPYNTTISALPQGNRKILGATYSSGNYGNHFATFKIPESGKWYVEMLAGVQAGSGNRSQLLVNEGHIIPTQGTNMASNANSTGLDLSLYHNTLDTYDGGSTVGTQVTSGLTGSYVVLALAIDVDNNKVYGGYDSGSAITWLNSGDPAGNSNGTAHTFTSDSKIGAVTSTSSDNANRSYNVMNFGQSSSFAFSSWTSRGNADGNGEGDFYYAPPSGFLALCSKNLPTPTIKDPSAHFQTTLYAGDSNNSTVITNSGNSDLQPDLIWIKNRTHGSTTGTGAHMIFDAVRGIKSNTGSDSPYLSTNVNDAEVTNSNGLLAVSSDGFTPGSMTRTNETGDNLVAWQWKAGGGAGSSNTDGSINTTSTSANTTAGISIGTYTGTGGTQTVGHGLGKVPSVIILKSRSHAIDWCIYHKGAASSPEDGSLTFNDTSAFDDNDNRWNDTAPTSSVFTIYSSNEVNDSGKTYVYYAFSEIENFSKFGSYTGNGSADGPFVNTGFQPAWIMTKIASTTVTNGGDWTMRDVKRDIDNPANTAIYTNLFAAEGSSSIIYDIYSNGFKAKSSYSDTNQSSQTFIYMAFAEFPFKYANAR